MTADRHKRVEAIFLAVADLPREQWEREIAERCAGDTDIKSEVESLLGCHQRADRFLDDGQIRLHSFSSAHAYDDALKPGTRISEYVIERLAGTGGMGHVYIARQDRPRRTVALKVIRHSVASQAMLRRFEQEADVLGRLHHPGIAQIYEAGVARFSEPGPAGSDGQPGAPTHLQPFIAMELVVGLALTDHASEKRLSTRDRLELIAKVCDAVHHAHQRGVIHRDLKPANILVAEDGQPKVLDFGVARATDADLRVTTHQTGIGQLIGTLPYMSPEQVIGDPAELDTRSDVYALGVVLYELLTGRLPYDFANRALPEAARLIREQAPARLSTVDRTLRGDIETIVFKALAKDKNRRYQSAAELAADLRAHLQGRAIAARTDSAMYVIGRQMARHKGAVAAAAVFLIAALVFAVHTIRQSRDNAALAVRANRELASSNVERGRLLGLSGNTSAAEEVLWPEFLKHVESRRVFFALWEVYSRERCLATLPAPAPGASRIRLSADGRRLAASGGDPGGGVLLYDTDTFEKLNSFGPTGTTINGLAYSPTGVIATGDDTGRVSVWNPDTGEEIAQIIRSGPKSRVVDLAFNASGTLLAAAFTDGTVLVLDPAPGTPNVPAEDDPRSGDWRVIARWRGSDARPTAIPVSIAFDPVADQLAVGCRDSCVRIFIVPELAPIREFSSSRTSLSTLSYSRDGGMLAVTGAARLVRIWNPHTGDPITTLSTPNGTVRGVQFTHDGEYLLSIGWWELQISSLRDRKPVRVFSTRATGADLALSPDSRVVWANLGSSIQAWDLDPDAGRTMFDGRPDRRTLACFLPNDQIVSGDGDGGVRLLSKDGEPVTLLGSSATRVRCIKFSPTAPLAVTADAGDMVMLFDWQKKEKLNEWTGYRMTTNSGMSFNSTGTRLALPTADNSFKIIAIPSGQVLLTLPKAREEALGIAFSPDDRILAASRRGETVTLYDATTGALIRKCESPERSPWSVVFSPDGRSVLAGNWSHEIDVWDVATGRMVRRLHGHRGLVTDLAFKPGEPSILASSASDGRVMLWDMETDQNIPILTLERFDEWEIWALGFDRTGVRLMATNGVGLSAIWNLRHFNRHMGGNMLYQVEQHRAELGPDFDDAAAKELAALLIGRGKKIKSGE